MNGYLLDTNVVSMLSPSYGAESPAFIDWLGRMDSDGKVFLSVVTVHEIEKGIERLEARGATAKAAGLKTWLHGLMDIYGDKIIPFDTACASVAGRLEAQAIAAGHSPGMADAIIAGIATVHDLNVVTVNSKHFLALGLSPSSPDQLS